MQVGKILSRQQLISLSGIKSIDESRREMRYYSDLTSEVRVFLKIKVSF